MFSSGVRACVVANKVAGVLGHALTGEWVKTSFAAEFSGAERPRRRLGKVAGLEGGEART